MRVAVSGGLAVGKTTLIQFLAPHLRDYAVVPDYVDVVLEEEGFASPRQLTDESARRIRWSALERKIADEKANEDFLSDKSVIDYFAYTLIWWRLQNEEEINRWREKIVAHASVYEKVVIPPLGRFPVVDNGKRTTSLNHQFRVHALIKGIYTELGITWQEYSLNLSDSPEKVLGDLGL
ncbi:MAG: AAA family ATPase [Candidatus Woesearchaeota archaeon]